MLSNNTAYLFSTNGKFVNLNEYHSDNTYLYIIFNKKAYWRSVYIVIRDN